MATNRRFANFDSTVCCFFVLFLSVYFLESIGGFFMTSAIVSIEKQFQIPSKISGLMVSAGDFGYIPSVVFVAYLGSKGNRARWIGGGCILIAVANLLISSSHFLFPVEKIKLNTSTLEWQIESDIRRLPVGTGFDQFLAELPAEQWAKPIRHKLNNYPQETSTSWLSEFDQCMEKEWNLVKNGNETCLAFYRFLRKHNTANKNDVDNLRSLSTTSYAFCDRTLNALRSVIEKIRCNKDVSNIGPTATIFFGLLILGIGRTMPFSLGLPLIDDNVRKTNLPLYFAGMFCIRIMGPMIGFWMGSVFNKLYYDGEAPHGITPRDPMWIGRWWQGFMLIGGVLFFPSLLLFCFRNPKPKENNQEKLVEGEEKVSRGLALVDRHLEKSENGNIPKSFNALSSDFQNNIATVFKRPVYRWAMIGRIIDVLAFKGFHIFLPKYLELQFGIPQYIVNRLMGVVGIVAFAIGVLCGSLLMRKLHLQGRRAALLVAITGVLSACFSILNSTVGCKSTMTALGESIVQSRTHINPTTNFNCLKGCFCDGSPLYPVCDRSGSKVFFSPCHAGCQITNITSILNTQKTPIFDSCSCAIGGKVSRDFCDEGDCWNKLLIVGGMGVVPGVLIMLRLHSLYGALRLCSFIADLFVIYHSKGLKLTDSDDEKLEEDKEENKKLKDSSTFYQENGVVGEQEQQKIKENDLERNNNHVHNISCAPPDYENEREKELYEKELQKISAFLESNKNEDITEERRLSLPQFSPQKSFSLPRDLKPGIQHRRTASRDEKELNEKKDGILISPSEFEAIRRSTSHLPFIE
uniref:Solute carrier organic anion transporter family member n=1 Tax=Meloidogyne hapla TaxID=6305 RepID=A0A1I8BMF6_MELHA